MNGTHEAVVVGSGPNGLAAAITLARAGWSVTVLEAASYAGGGLRTDEVAPGVWRDHCAAVMPFAAGSPFFQDEGGFSSHGVEWLTPEVSFAHPLDDGRAGIAFLDLDTTVDALGEDGRRYRRLIEPLARRWDRLAGEVLRPLPHVPRHVATLARFGLPGLLPSSRLARLFESDEARGLLAGCAAHSVLPLDRPFTGAFALLFSASAHSHGWPVPRGGASRLADAMVACLEGLGGSVATGRHVRSMADIPPAAAVVFDLDPAQVISIAGDRLSPRYRRRLRRFRHGPGVFKVDYLLSEPVPWSNETARRAGTVHVGGTFAEVASAEADVAAGSHPDRPFVLTAQAGVVDSSRAPAGQHVFWAYTHVPAGSTVDMTRQITDQVERFAPGFRDVIVQQWVTTPALFEAENPVLVGGDITGGSLEGLQLVRRPRVFDPYGTSDERLFLGSASTPPGGGIHGMCGWNAAQAVLGRRR